jgi:mycothiol synthase
MISMDSRPRQEKSVQITPFEPARASAAELSEYVRVELAASSADEPDERVLTADSALARLTRPPSEFQRRIHWVARVPAIAEPVGVAMLALFGAADSDLAAIRISVDPGQRRRGIGTALLREQAMAAGSRNTLFMENIRPGTPAHAFADYHQFAVVQRTAQLSLDLACADRGRWEVGAAPGYRLARWTDAAPEDLLASYATARNAIRQAPHGDMSFTEPEWTPMRVRDEEGMVRGREGELRVVAAVHQQTGEVAGLTYLVVYRNRPELADQEDTAVLAAHRGHGLGIWMKAANLKWLAADRPLVKRVRTSNAADNEHMLRVNRQVGFRVDVTSENREASTADLVRRLALGSSTSRP